MRKRFFNMVGAAITSTALVGIVAVGVSPASAAVASSASTGPRLVSVTRTPMTEHRPVSVTRQGSVTRITMDNGQQVTMPTTTYQAVQARVKQGVTPNNTVFGNCGYSYTYLYNWYGTRQYRLAVGFHVNHAATWYSWEAEVQGAGNTRYNYTYNASGDLWFRSDWAGGHTGTVPRADYYDADTTYGVAELWTGDFCFAGYTSDSTYVN